MRKSVFVAAAVMLATPVLAAPPVATVPAAAAPAPATGFSVEDSEIGTLLDDPAAKAVLVKYLPTVVSSDQIAMARSMTLKNIQQYKPEEITDQVLANIQTDLNKIPVKK